MIRALITNIAHYLPQRTVTWDELAQFIEEDFGHLKSKLGTERRRFEIWQPELYKNKAWLLEPPRRNGTSWQRDGDEYFNFDTDMALIAARKLNITQPLDRTYHATSTPSLGQPNGASVIAHGLSQTCATYDVLGGCAEWLNALILAHERISIGGGSQLVTAANMTSSHLRSTLELVLNTSGKAIIPKDHPDAIDALIFGDGAAAVLVQPVSGEFGIIATTSKTYGATQIETFPAGGCRFPASKATLLLGMHNYQLNMHEINRYAVPRLCDAVREVMQEARLHNDDVRYFLLHQPGRALHARMIEKLNIEPKKAPSRVSEYANLATANIPVLLSEIFPSLDTGDTIILASVGAGMDVAAIAYRHKKI